MYTSINLYILQSCFLATNVQHLDPNYLSCSTQYSAPYSHYTLSILMHAVSAGCCTELKPPGLTLSLLPSPP